MKQWLVKMELRLGAWAAATFGAVGALAGLMVAISLDRWWSPGIGGVWFGLTLAVGGLALHLLKHGQAEVCDTSPSLQPLQISGLALLGLGVHVRHSQDERLHAFTDSWLTTWWLSYGLIAAGIGLLAWRSLFATCRDDQLAGR